MAFFFSFFNAMLYYAMLYSTSAPGPTNPMSAHLCSYYEYVYYVHVDVHVHIDTYTCICMFMYIHIHIYI